jgi:hypothetical protein
MIPLTYYPVRYTFKADNGQIVKWSTVISGREPSKALATVLRRHPQVLTAEII